jgi:hypothetical protein
LLRRDQGERNSKLYRLDLEALSLPFENLRETELLKVHGRVLAKSTQTVFLRLSKEMVWISPIEHASID